MTTPQRVQQKRIKGWRMPEGARSVTRWCKWANPFIIDEARIPDAKTAVKLYRMFLRIPGNPLIALLPELRGHSLACYCKPNQPCHADVLLELAYQCLATDTRPASWRSLRPGTAPTPRAPHTRGPGSQVIPVSPPAARRCPCSSRTRQSPCRWRFG